VPPRFSMRETPARAGGSDAKRRGLETAPHNEE